MKEFLLARAEHYDESLSTKATYAKPRAKQVRDRVRRWAKRVVRRETREEVVAEVDAAMGTLHPQGWGYPAHQEHCDCNSCREEWDEVASYPLCLFSDDRGEVNLNCSCQTCRSNVQDAFDQAYMANDTAEMQRLRGRR